MSEQNKNSNVQRMREAIKNRPPLKKPSLLHKPTAAAKKHNPRTFKARDERAKKRGRLPTNVRVEATWDGEKWVGLIECREPDMYPIIVLGHQADGLFRLMEELDIKFWQWYSKEATADQKAKLIFAPSPPAPAAWPGQTSEEVTASENR